MLRKASGGHDTASTLTEKRAYEGAADRKHRYRQLCAREDTIPLFSRDWWLDAIAGEARWDVALVESGGEIVAAMPYTIKKRLGLTILGQPPLTPSLGPWFRSYDGKDAVGYQKALQEALIDQLPEFDHFRQNWHPDVGNWIPFYWRGFSQTTQYTYVLPDISNEKALWQALQGNIRREIKKAIGRHSIRVKAEASIDTFLSLNRKVFQRQGMALPYDEGLVRSLDAAAAERSCRRILIAEEPTGRAHAGVYLVWDAHSSYYLMGGSDPALRTSGAISLCLWEAVHYARTVSRQFDFEGSMIEPIERFFRGFGAVQRPYFQVSKTPSRLLRTRQFLLDLVRKKKCCK